MLRILLLCATISSGFCAGAGWVRVGTDTTGTNTISTNTLIISGTNAAFNGGVTANYFTSTNSVTTATAVVTNYISYPVVTLTSSGGAATVDWSAGSAFKIVLTENTTFSFSNMPSTNLLRSVVVWIQQAASGGPYTVTWPSAAEPPGGTAPTMTTTASAKDRYTLVTDPFTANKASLNWTQNVQ